MSYLDRCLDHAARNGCPRSTVDGARMELARLQHAQIAQPHAQHARPERSDTEIDTLTPLVGDYAYPKPGSVIHVSGLEAVLWSFK